MFFQLNFMKGCRTFSVLIILTGKRTDVFPAKFHESCRTFSVLIIELQINFKRSFRMEVMK